MNTAHCPGYGQSSYCVFDYPLLAALSRRETQVIGYSYCSRTSEIPTLDRLTINTMRPGGVRRSIIPNQSAWDSQSGLMIEPETAVFLCCQFGMNRQ